MVTPGGPAIAYDLEYTYDQLGNRFMKIDHAANPDLFTVYHYDTDDAYDRDGVGGNDPLPFNYKSRNNRLMFYEVREGHPITGTLIEKAWYAYNRGGHVKQIARNFPTSANPTRYYIQELQYTASQNLWLVRGLEYDGPTCTDAKGDWNFTLTYVREFRYATDRARYMVRERNVTPDANGHIDLAPVSTTWHDYVNDNIYKDLEISPTTGAATVVARYVHGNGLVSLSGGPGIPLTSQRFFHADMLGTTRLMTGAAGASAAKFAWTAFGESLAVAGSTAETRYGYVGSGGYQDDGLADPSLDIGLLHVGARYYDSMAGRFAQRDVIGIAAGPNTYLYVLANPTAFVDPGGYLTLTGTLSGAGIQGSLFGTYGVAIYNSSGAVAGVLGGLIALEMTGTFMAHGDWKWWADDHGHDWWDVGDAIEQIKEDNGIPNDDNVDLKPNGDVFWCGRKVATIYDYLN